jgi:hypothetical protein
LKVVIAWGLEVVVAILGQMFVSFLLSDLSVLEAELEREFDSGKE